MTRSGGGSSPSAMAGFDKWGFRNRKVPETSDIVAVGDSHTYGNTARMVESWPYVLGTLTGLKVYNMGMGGYGPNQYFYLSKTKALTLKPRMIIWGLYMGDDFEGAYSMTYGLDYWATCASFHPRKSTLTFGKTRRVNTWDQRIRALAVTAQRALPVGVFTRLGGRVKGEVQIKNAAQLYPGVATSLIDSGEEHLGGLCPESDDD